MNTDRDRLEDQNIEEALGRVTPPDLTKRILKAANAGLDDAVTPISGVHSVPRNLRPPAGRRMTAAVPRRNWQGAGIVATFAVLFTAGLAAFVLLKDPAPHVVEPDTAETRQTDERTGTEQNTNQSPPRKRWSPDGNDEQTPGPEPKNQSASDPEPEESEKRPQPKPEPEPMPERPDDVVKQPRPEPKQPEPEPEPKDSVEQPEDDTETVAPEPKQKAVVASISAARDVARAVDVRMSSDDRWERADKSGLITHDEVRNAYLIVEGTQLRADNQAVTLSNNAQLFLDGEAALNTHAEGMSVELFGSHLYIDNMLTGTAVRVISGEHEVVVGEGAGLFEARRSRLDVFCVDGELSVGGRALTAGQLVTVSSRGVSEIGQAQARDWNQPILAKLPPRVLAREDFDVEPAGGLYSCELERRSAEDLDADRDGGVAVGRGNNGLVKFLFEDHHTVVRDEVLRIRFRQHGATKLILQCWNTEADDNFGVDLPAGEEGVWRVIEVSAADLRDRESGTIAPKPGDGWRNFSFSASGSDTTMEVDWVEYVRVPDYRR